jgi:hypothetical protein
VVEVPGAEPFEIERGVPVAGPENGLDHVISQCEGSLEILDRELDPSQLAIVPDPHRREAEPVQPALGLRYSAEHAEGHPCSVRNAGGEARRRRLVSSSEAEVA